MSPLVRKYVRLSSHQFDVPSANIRQRISCAHCDGEARMTGEDHRLFDIFARADWQSVTKCCLMTSPLRKNGFRLRDLLLLIARRIGLPSRLGGVSRCVTFFASMTRSVIFAIAMARGNCRSCRTDNGSMARQRAGQADIREMPSAFAAESAMRKGSGRTFVVHVTCAHAHGTFSRPVRARRQAQQYALHRVALYSEQHDVAGDVSISVNGSQASTSGQPVPRDRRPLP